MFDIHVQTFSRFEIATLVGTACLRAKLQVTSDVYQ
jgi:hypothetical protein